MANAREMEVEGQLLLMLSFYAQQKGTLVPGSTRKYQSISWLRGG
jgi:hypothetical protein